MKAPLTLVLAFACAGCGGGVERAERVWGKRGVLDGEFVKPRAIAIDTSGKKDRLFIVDFSARIQAFDRDGKYLGPTWTTPDFSKGRPSGLSIDAEGNLVVSDSHYCCVRVYSKDGTLLQTVGGNAGSERGQFGYISDTVRDGKGNFYIAEFGENHRITKLAPDGSLLTCWGSPGAEPGQFARIRGLALGPDDLLYVADSCNHRIQSFTLDGNLVHLWGDAGAGPGQLSYPYDVAVVAQDGEVFVYVVEFGNHRVQKFTSTGQHKATWGGPGREEGKLSSPWALALDREGRVHVVDSGNDRVQRIDMR